ncbi:MAG: prepilin peptidase [Lachnospiraceae bacterium]|nr:prepilin peptidase [Lachnospiraceae bacterium]
MIMFAGTALVLISAAITDVRSGRIPNILVLILAIFQTFYFIISKFVLNTSTLSGSLIYERIIAAAAVFLLLYPFFKLGGLSAGDVKLLTLTVLSVKDPLIFLLIVFLIGAVFSVITLFSKQSFINKGPKAIHMALPILLGYCATYIPFVS